MSLGNDLVTRLRAPSTAGVDGVLRPDWKSPESSWTKVDYPDSQFQPLSTQENVVAQQRTEATHQWFAPGGADVLVTDRIRRLGVDYEVDGEPARWPDETGVEDHVEVRCFRVQGG